MAVNSLDGNVYAGNRLVYPSQNYAVNPFNLNSNINNLNGINGVQTDSFELQAPKSVNYVPEMNAGEVNTKETENDPVTIEELKQEYEEIKKGQGFVGKAWNGVKNKLKFLSKIGMKGSNEIEEIIKKAEDGEISTEEAKKEIEKYKKNQNNTKEFLMDTATVGVVAAACLLAGPLGWGVGVTLAVGAAVGAASRLGLGIAEAATNEVEGDYGVKDGINDAARGGVIGFLTALGKTTSVKIGGKFKRLIANESIKDSKFKNWYMSNLIKAIKLPK